MAIKELTGRHVAIIFVSAFAVIVGVNLTMAYKALDTFPGLDVANSYVASQQFDARRTAQIRLGWTIESGYANGVLTLGFRQEDGSYAMPRDFTLLVGRPTEARDDSRPEFTRSGGIYTAPVDLTRGKWMLLLDATAQDGTAFRQRLNLYVKG